MYNICDCVEKYQEIKSFVCMHFALQAINDTSIH